MPKAKSYRELHERVLARPGAADRVAAHREEALVDIGLYELRRMEGVSQVELAARLDVTQPAISKIENAEDWRLSTLREYVEALGADLEICARFPDRVVSLELNRSRPTPGFVPQ